MKIGILGNGSLGCTTALNLAEAGHQVLLFEKPIEKDQQASCRCHVNSLGEVENNQLDFEP